MLGGSETLPPFVHKKVGLAFLRRGWIKVDVLWGCVLILAGVLTVLVTEV